MIKRIRYKSFELSTTRPNNTVMLDNGNIVNIKEIYNTNSSDKNICIKGNLLRIIGNVCDTPINSDVLNMYEVVEEEKNLTVALLTTVKYKMVYMQIFEVLSDVIKCYVVPLLHT